MKRSIQQISYTALFFFVFSFFVSIPVHASITNGTIDSTNKYAKALNSNAGTINFGATQGNVHITDTLLTGYVWGDKLGWINLAPAQGGVLNNGNGVLSGNAWGEQAGWVNFAPTLGGVTINSSGDFNGYAWSQNFGWILFNCATNSSCGVSDFKVSTDWRPRSARPACNNALDDDNDGRVDYPADGGCSSLLGTSEVGDGGPGGGGGIVVDPGGGGPGGNPGDTDPGGNGGTGGNGDNDGGDTGTNGGDPGNTDPGGNGDGGNGGDTGGGQGGNPGNTDPGGNGDGGAGDSGGTLNVVEGIGNSGGGGGLVNQILTNFPSSISETVNQIGNQVVQSIVQTTQAVKVIGRVTKKAVQTPAGKAVTETVATAGVVGGFLSTLSALFVNPISLSEIVLIPFRIWSLLLAVFGLKKKNRPWGTVYDSVTKQPLDPAYVTLLDLKGAELASSITDLDGRYGFLVTPGLYKVVAGKTNYIFPSKKLAGKTRDELYGNLYFGEELLADEFGEVVKRNIPMDPENFDWNEFAKKNMKINRFYSRWDLITSKISNVVFPVGFVLAFLALIFAPAPYNIIMFGLYVVIFLLKIFGVKPKTFGRIIDKTGKPLPYAIVKVLSKSLGEEILSKVTDQYGKYYCLVPNGDYQIKIDQKNPDESYTPVFTSGDIHVTEGIINQNFTM